MAYKIVLASLPVASAALYLAYLHFTLAGKVQCQTTPYLRDKSIAIPDNVQSNLEEYTVHHECARKSIPTAALKTASESEMLTRFLRQTMATFSRYPPAWGLWYLTKDAKDPNTFALYNLCRETASAECMS
jgi:hypothetical protein